MLKPGDIVNLTYYKGQSEVEATGWVVDEYDNGLLKAHEPGGRVEVRGKVIEWEDTKPTIFNLRSISFVKVELAG